MRNSTARFLSSITSTTVLASGVILCTSVSGGAQAPLPGDNPPIDIQGDPSAPMPGAGPSPYTAPPPQAGRIGSASQAQPAHKGSYAQLPLNLTDAKNKVAQLRGLLTTARPQEMEAAIDHMNEWLSDIQDAHNKMANAFSKQDATKPEAAAEKQAANSFWQLKHQVQLIKAELLISQHRYPEALGPLVDIVVAEPVSATGKKAYDK
ncbi:MAG TPA: hypothetical protein V6C72_15975, partial [Chroococcales cyanobacterium]